MLPKSAFAILEAGSAEDLTDMQNRWAAMLAYAADPNTPELLPALPKVLAEMSHHEVRALNALCRKHNYDNRKWNVFEFTQFDFLDLVGDSLDGQIAFDNVVRLGVIHLDSAEGAGKDAAFSLSLLGMALMDATFVPE